MGPRLPDRADDPVWGLSELFPSLAARGTTATPLRRHDRRDDEYCSFS